MADASQYTNLITSEHADKPKFVAMVGTVAGSFADVTNTMAEIQADFDLDAAVGAQLDVIGLWVGLSRQMTTPITGVYFTLDDSALGFDQGVWKGPYDPTDGIVNLDDSTYRAAIRIKIGINTWDGTLPSYEAILNSALATLGGAGSYIFAIDNQDMSMSLFFWGNGIPAILKQMLTNGYLDFRPEGVEVTAYTATIFFGFDLNTSSVKGFDLGSWALPF